jgi:biotin carboxyl carrier protein
MGNSAGVAPSTPARSAPEALDEVIRTTRPRLWWALSAISAAVVAVMIWSVLATVPQQISVRGVVAAGDLLRVVPAPITGSVRFLVDSGSVVTEREEIAEITPFEGGVAVSLRAPVSGTVQTIAVSEGSGVQPGDTLLTILQPPSPQSGILVKTFVNAAVAQRFSVGESAQVLVVNLQTGQPSTAQATIESVDDVPSTQAGIATATGSADIAEQFVTESQGVPYRVVLRITDELTDTQVAALQPGELLQIVRTYAEPRPIQILFGGQ